MLKRMMFAVLGFLPLFVAACGGDKDGPSYSPVAPDFPTPPPLAQSAPPQSTPSSSTTEAEACPAGAHVLYNQNGLKVCELDGDVTTGTCPVLSQAVLDRGKLVKKFGVINRTSDEFYSKPALFRDLTATGCIATGANPTGGLRVSHSKVLPGEIVILEYEVTISNDSCAAYQGDDTIRNGKGVVVSTMQNAWFINRPCVQPTPPPNTCAGVGTPSFGFDPTRNDVDKTTTVTSTLKYEPGFTGAISIAPLPASGYMGGPATSGYDYNSLYHNPNVGDPAVKVKGGWEVKKNGEICASGSKEVTINPQQPPSCAERKLSVVSGKPIIESATTYKVLHTIMWEQGGTVTFNTGVKTVKLTAPQTVEEIYKLGVNYDVKAQIDGTECSVVGSVTSPTLPAMSCSVSPASGKVGDSFTASLTDSVDDSPYTWNVQRGNPASGSGKTMESTATATPDITFTATSKSNRTATCKATVTELPPTYGIKVTKTASVSACAPSGGAATVNFSGTVKNNSSVSITAVLTDALAPACNASVSLAPGETKSYSCSGQFAPGNRTNEIVATIQGQSVSDTATAPFSVNECPPAPTYGVDITKTASVSACAPSGGKTTVNFSGNVKSTSSVDVVVDLTDVLAPSCNGSVNLAPGETKPYSCSGQFSPGSNVNEIVAKVRGQSASDNATAPFTVAECPPAPTYGVDVTKDASVTACAPQGGTARVNFSGNVKNTSSVTASVERTDALVSSCGGTDSLAAGQSKSYSCNKEFAPGTYTNVIVAKIPGTSATDSASAGFTVEQCACNANNPSPFFGPNGSVGSVRQVGSQVFVDARWKARNIQGKKAAILWRNGGSQYIKDWDDLNIACDAGYVMGVISWDSTSSSHLPSNGAKYWLVLWTNNDRSNPTTEGTEFPIPLQ